MVTLKFLIEGTLFYVVTCYENALTSEDYESAIYEYRPIHISSIMAVFIVVLLIILGYFAYLGWYLLNKNLRRIRSLFFDLMKYSVDPQMFGNRLY